MKFFFTKVYGPEKSLKEMLVNALSNLLPHFVKNRSCLLLIRGIEGEFYVSKIL